MLVLSIRGLYQSAQGVYVPFQERQIGGKSYQHLSSYTWVMDSIFVRML